MGDRSAAPAAGEPDSDAQLALKLGRALHTRLDGVPVDGGLLLEGARHGAVVRRRRRTVVVAAAVAAVVLVPATVIAAEGVRGDGAQVTADAGEVLLRQGNTVLPDGIGGAPAGPSGAPEPTQRSGPGAATTTPAPQPSQPSSERTGPSEPTGSSPVSSGSPMLAGPGSIPSPLVEAADLPQPMVLGYSLAAVRVPSVPGQQCNQGLPGLVPTDGQIEDWAEEVSNRMDQLTVNVSVTRWAPGESVDAFAEVETDSGRCRFMDEGAVTAWQPAVGQEGLQRSRQHESLDFSASVLRTGDLLVGVEVAADAGTPGLVEGSSAVAEAVAARLAEAGAVGEAG